MGELQLEVYQIDMCNKYSRDLYNTANVLYSKYILEEKFHAREQCLDFKRMELECMNYNKKIKKEK